MIFVQVMSYPEKQAVEAWRKAKESAYQQCAQVNRLHIDRQIVRQMDRQIKNKALEAWRKAKESAYQECAQVNRYID